MKNPLDRLVRIEVTDEPVLPGRTGSNERGPWTIPPKQACWLHQDEPYPTRVEIAVPPEGPRKPGMYLFAGKPFAVGVVGKYARVTFSEAGAELVSIEEVTAALTSRPALKAAS